MARSEFRRAMVAGAILFALGLAAPPVSAEGAAAEPTRAHYGFTDLYAPTFFAPKNGTYDILIHFHGVPQLQEENIEKSRLNVVVVSINLGISSSNYDGYTADPQTLDKILAHAQHALEASGRAQGAHVGRIAVSAWSAGFAAVGGLLARPENVRRIDAVFLEDAPHANYLEGHIVNDQALSKYVQFAMAAMRGEKLFALTHSSIGVSGYASTTEAVTEMLKMAGVEKHPTDVIGPRNMHEIYAVDRGSFHVHGYAGTQKEDHIDHIKGMSETLIPYLKARWR